MILSAMEWWDDNIFNELKCLGTLDDDFVCFEKKLDDDASNMHNLMSQANLLCFHE